MNKFTALLLLFPLLISSGCSSLPDRNETPVVRFALRDENIQSWEEKGDGIAVQLNREGQRKLASLTRNNPHSEMEIYAGRIFLTSSMINRPLRGENLFVSVDDDVKDQVLALLPQAKRS